MMTRTLLVAGFLIHIFQNLSAMDVWVMTRILVFAGLLSSIISSTSSSKILVPWIPCDEGIGQILIHMGLFSLSHEK